MNIPEFNIQGITKENNHKIGDKIISDFMGKRKNYHTSWDKMIPVLDKIGTLVYPYYEDTVNKTWKDDYSLSELLQNISYRTRPIMVNDLETLWTAVTLYLIWFYEKR